jgi:hypothetical protein
LLQGGGIDWSTVEFSAVEKRVISRNRKWAVMLWGRFSVPLMLAMVRRACRRRSLAAQSHVAPRTISSS